MKWLWTWGGISLAIRTEMTFGPMSAIFKEFKSLIDAAGTSVNS